MVLVLSCVLVGCTPKIEYVTQYETVYISLPEALLAPCRMTPVGMDAYDYESALYALTEAYIASAKNMAKCNERIRHAREYQRSRMEKPQ